MKIEYDPKAKAMYIYIRDVKIAKSQWANEAKTVAMDYDADGNVIGLELLHIEEPHLISYELLSKRVLETK
ncbi:MAG: DUF2283 domain-containing protein [Anaerolineae bacterium]|nr:DUF2283 domain-containing protein [Anaerolineae bacterium]MDQ7037485.1 DUF2283 domain-containing protein [Anaerolineae bacterium]